MPTDPWAIAPASMTSEPGHAGPDGRPDDLVGPSPPPCSRRGRRHGRHLGEDPGERGGGTPRIAPELVDHRQVLLGDPGHGLLWRRGGDDRRRPDQVRVATAGTKATRPPADQPTAATSETPRAARAAAMSSAWLGMVGVTPSANGVEAP